MRILIRRRMRTIWHPWFAWYPVKVSIRSDRPHKPWAYDIVEYVWGSMVYRKRIHNSEKAYWVYSKLNDALGL